MIEVVVSSPICWHQITFSGCAGVHLNASLVSFKLCCHGFMSAMYLFMSCRCFFLRLAIWQYVMHLWLFQFLFLLAANCSAATTTWSSIEYAGCVPMALSSLMYIRSSGKRWLSLQSSDGGAMIILTPADILSGCAGPLSAGNMSSHAWPLFRMIVWVWARIVPCRLWSP